VRSAEEAAVDEGDVPSGHFSNLVTAFTLAAAINEGGQTALGMSGDVVDVPDRCVTERISTGVVAKPYELGEPAV
jgi:hypothetical protein